MADEEKLDWIYKSANSLVSREEYLLGRKVDNALEQLNKEEKEKKIVLPTPKNHVEHECIPPSIRDFNKIVHSEQVDLSAKLQEDPLVAIRKREEEARRKFLQNPVQLKKLQDALMQQEKEKKIKKSHKKHSERDLDAKIREKLRSLKSSSVNAKGKKKAKGEALNTILMHKFNALKDKLTDDDLNDILNGKTDSSSEESEQERKKEKKRSTDRKNESNKYTERRRSKSQQGKETRERNRSRSSQSSEKIKDSIRGSHKSKRRHSSESSNGEKNNKQNKSAKNNLKASISDSNDGLDEKIMAKLKLLRNAVETSSKKQNQSDNSSSDASDTDSTNKKRVLLPERPAHLQKRNDSSSDTDDNQDSDGEKVQKKKFGLVTSDGKRIALKNTERPKAVDHKAVKKIEPAVRMEKKAKKLTDEEKEKLRKEMMQNAEVRNKERAHNLKKHRENEKLEEKSKLNYDKDLIHSQLLKIAKLSSVEDRIQSKLNNIQRSSRHMDSNFAKR